MTDSGKLDLPITVEATVVSTVDLRPGDVLFFAVPGGLDRNARAEIESALTNAIGVDGVKVVVLWNGAKLAGMMRPTDKEAS